MPATEEQNPLPSRFLSELAGSVGNFGTVLPFLFAISVACGMDISLMLFWAAVWYGICGLYYRIPIPVEPLKAIGAIAIADNLAPHIIAASGILVGVICFFIGVFGCMNRIRKVIPESVIRGVQLGLAFILVKSAIPGFIIPDLTFTSVSIGIILLFYLIRKFYKVPDLSALCIIGAGFLVSFIFAGLPTFTTFPVPGLVIPSPEDFFTATVVLLPPQLPLTLTNAILATSLLVTDLFARTENPDRLSKTIGVMSISSSLFGGFPMCHGAGGLAAHYRFGARGGLSLLFGGLFLLLIAGICADPAIVNALPIGMFGILLIVVAFELAKHGIKTKRWLVTGIIAVLSIPFGLAVSFCIGLLVAWTLRYREKIMGDEIP